MLFQVLLEKIGDSLIGHIPGNEGIADGARQNECQLAALGLLVLPHDVDEIGNRAAAVPRISLHMGGKACGFQVPGNPVRRARLAMLQVFGKAEGLDHADGNPFAMQEAVAVAGGGFKGMAEGVAEIEEGAHALFRSHLRQRWRPWRSQLW